MVRQEFGVFFTRVGCASIQVQILDLIHAYLNNSDLFAKWHELIFSKAIRSSDILCGYLLSWDVDKTNVPIYHKQMLLFFINSYAKNGTVLSDVVKKVQYDKHSVSVFYCYANKQLK